MGKTKKVGERVARADVRHAHKAASHEDGPVLTLAGKASELADQPPLIALSVATILAGAALRRPIVLRAGARMLASHLLATGAKTVLKSVVDRTRPARALKDGHSVDKGKGTDDSSLNSFPSGHTAGAVAVAQAVAAESRAAALPLQAAAIGVAVLQPIRGKHYLSDVAAGAVIGWAAERIVGVAFRTGTSRAEAWQDRRDADRAGSASGPPPGSSRRHS